MKNFRLLKNPHGGKAITVMTGLLASKGEIAMFTDMDQATPIDQLEKLLPKFKEGYDVVIGARKGREGAPFIRQLMSKGFVIARTVILNMPFSDTQCGFKGFTRNAITIVFPQLLHKWESNKASGGAVNAGFDIEALYLALQKGLKITDVPVEYRHVGSERVQAISDSLEALKDLLRIRIDALRGAYR